MAWCRNIPCGVSGFVIGHSDATSDSLVQCTDIMFATTACLGLARSVVNLDLIILLTLIFSLSAYRKVTNDLLAKAVYVMAAFFMKAQSINFAN